MATEASSKFRARIMLVLFLAIFGAIAWMVAPLFVPIYRWTEVDFQKIAEQHEIAVDRLEAKRQVTLRYQPRGSDDPLPWQMLVREVSETPDWVVDERGEKVNEYKTLVRVDLISDRSGEQPSSLTPRNLPQDRYYRAEAWRLPPGSLGRDHPRPVLLYDAATWEQMNISDAKVLHENLQDSLRKGGEDDWISDDDWQSRRDTYQR